MSIIEPHQRNAMLFTPNVLQPASYDDLVNALDPEQQPVGISSDMLMVSITSSEQSFSFDNAARTQTHTNSKNVSMDQYIMPSFASLSASLPSTIEMEQAEKSECFTAEPSCCQNPLSSLISSFRGSFKSVSSEDITFTSTVSSSANESLWRTSSLTKILGKATKNDKNKTSISNGNGDPKMQNYSFAYLFQKEIFSFESFDSSCESEKISEMENVDVPLYGHIENKDWVNVIARLKTHPHEASTWVSGGTSYDASEIENEHVAQNLYWKILPIHAACIFGSTSHVMSALVHGFPQSVNITDSSGKLPLHLACYSCHSADVVRVLIDASPKTVRTPDSSGKYPIDLCLSSHGVARDEIYSLLDNGIFNFPGKPPSHDYKKIDNVIQGG